MLRKKVHLDEIPALPIGSLTESFSKKGRNFYWVPDNIYEILPLVWTPLGKRLNIGRYNVCGEKIGFQELVDHVAGSGTAWRKVFFPSQIMYLIDKQPNGESGFLATDKWPNVFLMGGWPDRDRSKNPSLIPLFVSFMPKASPKSNFGWSIWTMPTGDLDPGMEDPSKFYPGRCHLIF